MRAVCQRVSEARVRVGGAVVGEIGPVALASLGSRRRRGAELASAQQ